MAAVVPFESEGGVGGVVPFESEGGVGGVVPFESEGGVGGVVPFESVGGAVGAAVPSCPSVSVSALSEFRFSPFKFHVPVKFPLPVMDSTPFAV